MFNVRVQCLDSDDGYADDFATLHAADDHFKEEVKTWRKRMIEGADQGVQIAIFDDDENVIGAAHVTREPDTGFVIIVLIGTTAEHIGI